MINPKGFFFFNNFIRKTKKCLKKAIKKTFEIQIVGNSK